ncbi:nucleotidyltransferase [Acidianus sulfidivorans JP7]|uniref:Nucleotidyltransferase n=1 Tax=Acidianus sulfidivorans JP7 TaxID=619593 RepID=A0A2U9IMZ6_9CREN|nr:nucleotidyltransferase domain-containing protein [Acidianus sulfidivorans]AWR97314.1 nucleotidyltransferase [Acidianus sulfidivorans JP7]
MGRSYFLDKDLIIDKDDNIFTIITNYNPPGYVFAYLKYKYEGNGLWKGYNRILKYYGVKNLMQISNTQEFLYEPCYDVKYPVLRTSKVKYHYKPEEKLTEIISKSHYTELEITMLDLLSKLEINLKIGIGGSLLLGIFHSKSDIDFIIYGKKSILDFINNFEGFEPDKEWIYETSRNYSLDLDLVKSIYTKKTRGIYRNIKYSFLFVDDVPWKYCETVCHKMKEIEIEGIIEGGSPNALIYPSSALLHSSNKVYKVVSYEGIFNYVMYLGGKVKVKGMLMKCEDEEDVIIIGDREVGGYIRPIL